MALVIYSSDKFKNSFNTCRLIFMSPNTQPIHSICVYCGASPGRQTLYADAACQLADTLAQHKIRLIYGGASIGLMGLVADRMLAAGGEVIGVIPKALAHKEIAHAHLSAIHITHSMHERKMLMAELSDGFIALPGGIGTLEELFEIWTWAQLGFHQKPCGLLNIDGYFDGLLQFLDHMTAEQFLQAPIRDMLLVDQHAETLLQRFQQYQAPAVKRWMNQDDT